MTTHEEHEAISWTIWLHIEKQAELRVAIKALEAKLKELEAEIAKLKPKP